jgi:uncharacterized membrane protein
VLETLVPGAQHLQNIHPLVVHFPLAFLPGAALFYVLAWLTGREPLAWTGLWLLVLGTVTAAVAAGTGLYAEEGVMVDPSVRRALLDVHEWWMLRVVGASVVLAGWGLVGRPLPRRSRAAFVFLLLVLVAALVRGADFGGRLVYDYNAGGNACGQPIEFSR